MTRIIYNLFLSETQSTLFEIRDDDLFVTNVTDGILGTEYNYFEIIAKCSNAIVEANPKISIEEWQKKFLVDVKELMDDVKELPLVYKKKVKELLLKFVEIYEKQNKKKFKAMEKNGFDFSSVDSLEGTFIDMETGKALCYHCNKDYDLKRCGRCLSIHYCSKECIRADWRRHKPNCVPCR